MSLPSVSAPGGTYAFQQQQLQGAGTQGGQACDCKKTGFIPAQEIHYNGVGNPGINTTGGLGNNTALDNSKSPTLANRVAMEFYNAGTQTLEISTSSQFVYGDGSGRPIAPGTAWSITIGPAAAGPQHYVACSSGTCDLRITELGG